MNETSTVERPGFLAEFRPVAERLSATGPDWLRALRREHRARFEALGLPSTRLEEWKNTDVSRLGRTSFAPADPDPAPPRAEELPAAARLELGGARLTFCDGRFVPALSSAQALPEGCRLERLADLLARDPERLQPWLERRAPDEAGPFCALNTALFEDGAALFVGDGIALERPVELVFLASAGPRPVATHPRVLVVVGQSASVSVVETHVGLGDGLHWTNTVSDAFVGDDARLDHVRLQLEGPGTIHLATAASHQTRDSRHRAWAFDLGARLARHDLRATIAGRGAVGTLWGLYLLRGEQHVDHHTIIDHAEPHGSSREVYKGILDERARSVFNGRIIVRQDAQKTDAKQSNPNLVLSNGALAHTRPQLEIYADDVKCTHGATVGRLDADAVFYLRSRGIPDAGARSLLIEAFAGEVLGTLELEPLGELLRAEVARRLPGGTT